MHKICSLSKSPISAMCEIFAKHPQQNYQFITRSIRIDGHATSVKLESSFWLILEEIAAAQDMTVPKFISTVYQEALKHNGEVNNFASLLRCACLTYARQPDETIEAAKQQLAG
jgi:predicted DNA-binding ribbon-helix-helix protein